MAARSRFLPHHSNRKNALIKPGWPSAGLQPLVIAIASTKAASLGNLRSELSVLRFFMPASQLNAFDPSVSNHDVGEASLRPIELPGVRWTGF
jgi:hypothetical protein